MLRGRPQAQPQPQLPQQRHLKVDSGASAAAQIDDALGGGAERAAAVLSTLAGDGSLAAIGDEREEAPAVRAVDTSSGGDGDAALHVEGEEEQPGELPEEQRFEQPEQQQAQQQELEPAAQQAKASKPAKPAAAAQGKGKGAGQQGAGGTPAGEAGEAGEGAAQPAGWSASYLYDKADRILTQLLDGTSLMSPQRLCFADEFSVGLRAREAEQLLADQVEGGPDPVVTLSGVPVATLVSGVAHNLPCARDAPGAAAGCCSHPVNFRKNTTDYRVFKQVFQCHYMRYLYTLFAAEPPRYILDAGANAGFSTILFKLLWPDATVVMLEPDRSNFSLLKRNTETLAGVHPFNAGLWGRTANITMIGNHGNWGKVFKEAGAGEPGMPAYSVADIAKLAGVPRFDFVKIDVEGAEGMVFAPGTDTAWIKQARAVSLEIHDFFAGYFGLKDVTSRVDAAFAPTGYRIVSDNEHVIYINDELAAQVAALKPPSPNGLILRGHRLRKISGC